MKSKQPRECRPKVGLITLSGEISDPHLQSHEFTLAVGAPRRVSDAGQSGEQVAQRVFRFDRMKSPQFRLKRASHGVSGEMLGGVKGYHHISFTRNKRIEGKLL